MGTNIVVVTMMLIDDNRGCSTSTEPLDVQELVAELPVEALIQAGLELPLEI